MIIDSADGDSHMILENMEAWESRENHIVAYCIGRNGYIPIGTFATHERAQQVAEDIAEAFIAGEKRFQMPPDEETEEDPDGQALVIDSQNQD